MQVHFPFGTTYMLVIDTNAYAGDFDREICAYVTGICDEDAPAHDEVANVLADAPELVQAFRDKSMLVTHAEYGPVSNTIRSTPGRINEGDGDCRDAEPGEDGWGAYESVAVFLSKPLTTTEMDYVRRRAHEYAAKPLGSKIKPLGITNVYLVEVTTKVEERRMSELDVA